MASESKYNSPLRQKSYVLALARLFLAGACTRRALFPIGISENGGFVLIDKAIKRGHISLGQYREKYGHRNLFQKYLCLTEQGANFLRSQSSVEWAKYIPQSPGSITPFPNTNSNVIALVTRSGNALLMALGAGAVPSEYLFTGTPGHVLSMKTGYDLDDTQAEEGEAEPLTPDGGYGKSEQEAEDTEEADGPPEETTLDQDGTQTKEPGQRPGYLPNIRRTTAINARADGLDMRTIGIDREPVYYFPRMEVKLALDQAGALGDMVYTKSTGFLCGPTGALVLYHAKHDGFGWLNIMERRDVHGACRFSSRCSPYKNITVENVRAAILVYGAKNFGDILRNKWKKRSDGTELGKIYKAVYLIPLGPDGAQLLGAIMEGNLDATIERVALETYHATTNMGMMKRSFPWVVNGVNVFNGADMDYKRISLTMYALDRQEQETGNRPGFVVLCYRWQMAFYNNLWPGVPFYPLDP